MNESEFLKRLDDQPDNEALRAEYYRWIEEKGDERASFIRLARRYLHLQEEVRTVHREMVSHPADVRPDWLNRVFPLQVRSPEVGHCYLRPQPDAADLIQVGSSVTPDTVIAIIEHLGLIHEISAGHYGIIRQIVVSNGAPVEFGQLLFTLDWPDEMFLNRLDW